tara:strand:+ start:3207 stop:4160 length:954 start_codon:yes stop_codon:yes gene_type:complete
MGKVDDLRRRMRGVQTDYAGDTGLNLHQEAALGVALAEQQGADETAQQTRDAKLLKEKAKSDATGQMISGGIQALSGPIGGIAKGKTGGGLIGMMKKGKGKGADVAGGELTKGQQRRADRQAARQAKREENSGGDPKVKGGLFAPLFTGGRVDTRGQWTEKGLQAKSDAANVSTNVPGVTGVDKSWGSQTPAEPKSKGGKNPLYKVGKSIGKAAPGVQNIIAINEIGKKPISADSPTKEDMKNMNKADAKAKEDRVSTFMGSRTQASTLGTNKYAQIYKMPSDQRSAAIAKLTPEQKAQYERVVSDYEKRRGLESTL